MHAVRNRAVQSNHAQQSRGAKKEERFSMNMYVKMIMEILGCDAARAGLVYDELCFSGVSLSNASKKKLAKYIREANYLLFGC
jgi:hypothetical protein